MSDYEIVLVLHLLGAFLVVAGAFLAAVAFESASRCARPSEVALLARLARVGALVVVAGALVLVGAGLWLANDLDQLGETWLVASLALFAVALVVGALGGQRPKRARLLASRLAAEDDRMTPELHRLLHDPLSRAANYASGVLLAVVLVLMVWQPGR
jgi:uncharacterized membrane protein